MLGQDKIIQRTIFSIKEAGREVECMSLREMAEAQETLNDERRCVVVLGSIYYNSQWRKQRPNWVGNWHDRNLMLCTKYYAYWGKYLVQRRYAMLPWSEVIRNRDFLFETYGLDVNGHKRLFVRPDSGEKEFVGQLVDQHLFDVWLAHLPGNAIMAPDMLTVVSTPQSFSKELRLVIADKKVVTGSTYYVGSNMIQETLEEQEDRDEIVRFAEQVLNDNPPPLPPVHVLDVAKFEDGYRVMEVGCFCCAGLYESDRTKIATAVSEVAEKEFHSSM